MEKLYSVRDIQKLFGTKRGRVRYWDKIGFLTPSVKIGRRKYYTAQDLIGLRTAKGLLDAGLSFAKVRCTVIDVKKISSPVGKFPHQLLIRGDRKGVFLDGGAGFPNPRGGLLAGFTQSDFQRGIKSSTMQIELDSKTQLKGRETIRGTPSAIRPSTKPKDP